MAAPDFRLADRGLADPAPRDDDDTSAAEAMGWVLARLARAGIELAAVVAFVWTVTVLAVHVASAR